VRRTCAAAIVLAAILCVDLLAHAALRFASPMEGAALGDAPSTVQLTFTEKPEPALSEIHVIDRSGLAYDVGRPALVPDDPFSVAINVRRLPTGVYTVDWRIVSAIDGHATTGAYAFGVRQSPSGVVTSGGAARFSIREAIARWILNVGLVVLIGAAFGDVARFAGSRAVPLASAGWALASVGLGLLVAAQPRSAGMSLGVMLTTSVGRTLAWRAEALAVAGLAIAAAASRRTSSSAHMRPVAMAVVLAAALVIAAVQAAAGHPAAAPSLPVVQIAAQWAHVAVSGLWLGGLAALLLGVRGAATPEKARAVSRFSTAAGAGILVVLLTGGIRAVAELTAWHELTATAYGRTLLVKLGFVAVLAGLGAANRLRSVPQAERTLRPLRRLGSAELLSATAALAAAAMLATLPPPASARPLPGITASGADFATTVRVSLSAVSNQPGPNRFSVRVTDYDSETPVSRAAVSLRFQPVDDPGVAATSLVLQETASGEYGASGANLAFDGRWRVIVRVQRGASTAEIPLDTEVTQPPLEVWIQQVPGAVNYNALVRAGGYIRFSLDPERAGRSRLSVSCYDMIQDERAIAHVVITHASGTGASRTLPFTRVGAGRFVADLELPAGANRFTAVASTIDGTRIRAWVDLQVPRR